MATWQEQSSAAVTALSQSFSQMCSSMGVPSFPLCGRRLYLPLLLLPAAAMSYTALAASEATQTNQDGAVGGWAINMIVAVLATGAASLSVNGLLWGLKSIHPLATCANASVNQVLPSCINKIEDDGKKPGRAAYMKLFVHASLIGSAVAGTTYGFTALAAKFMAIPALKLAGASAGWFAGQIAATTVSSFWEASCNDNSAFQAALSTEGASAPLAAS